MSDIVELVYIRLKKRIDRLEHGQDALHTTTEQAGFTDGVPAYTFANLPTNGLANGTTYVTVAFCSNGRKSGEGVGAGTGQLVYYNAPTTQWLRVRDDSVITV